MHRHLLPVFVGVFAAFCSSIAIDPAAMAAPAATPAEPQIEVLASGLDHPCGVAVRDDLGDNTHEIFVVEGGAGRVVRLRKKKTDDDKLVQPDGKTGRHVVPAVIGFKGATWGQKPSYPSGPLSVIYKQLKTGPAIIVGDGGQKLADLSVRVYQLPDEQKEPLPCEKFDEKFFVAFDAPPGDVATGKADELDPQAVCYFQSLALNNFTLFVTVHGAGPGRVLSADWTKTVKLTALPRDAAVAEMNRPTSIAVDQRGNLAVAQMGDWGDKLDSSLTIVGPKSGKAMFQAQTHLFDNIALAYSVKPVGSALVRQLFALDFAQAKPEQGGLYRLDSAEDGLKLGIKTAEKPLVKLDHPTAMAFAADGTLYVTIFGKSAGDDKPGQLLRIRF